MKNTYFLGFGIVLLFISGLLGQNALGQTTTSFTIDLTGQPNTNTFPYGICYDGTQYAYLTIFASGQLARVNVNTLAVTFFDNDSGVSGFDWYSCAVDPSTGKIIVNERDNGRTHIFDPSDNTFVTIPIPANIDDAELDYTDGYNTAPNKFTAVDSGNTYNLGCDSFGEIKITNGFAWQAFDCKFDFSPTDNTNGVTDYLFHGIVKINMSTESVVSRTSITGAQNLRGIDVDSVDSTILWITDITADKIFKFDTNTNTVTQTITLTAGSNARGITDDATHLYVASNKVGDGVASGKILNVTKSDGTVTTINTDAVVANGDSGVFEVDIARGFIMWSDQSRNIGTINLSTLAKTTTRTTDASSNHFGVLIGDTYWTAGKGSVVVTQTNLSSSGGGGSSWQSKPTFGISYLTNEQIVANGFGYDGKTKTITHNFHTDFEKVDIPTGESYTVFAKGYFPNDVWIQEFCFGIPEQGKGYLAESCVEVHFDSKHGEDKEITGTKIVQKSQVLNLLDVIHEMADCYSNTGKGLCDKTSVTLVFNEPLKYDVMMIKGIDQKRKTTETYLNEGFHVDGKQFTDLPNNMIPSPVKYEGLIKVTQSEKYSNIWISDDGKMFERNDFGSFYQINRTFERFQDTGDMRDRTHYKFADWKKTQAENAILYFDSSMIQGIDKGFIPSPDSGIDHREITLKKLSWNQ